MKNARQMKILEIIETYPTETQEELAERLLENGIKATQATISRDIKELQLVKVARPDGKQVYASIAQRGQNYDERVHNVFRQTVTSIQRAQNLIVIRTLPAMAQGAALAIDSLDWPEIAGTIAGDDTIFVAVFDQDRSEEIMLRFRKLAK